MTVTGEGRTWSEGGAIGEGEARDEGGDEFGGEEAEDFRTWEERCPREEEEGGTGNLKVSSKEKVEGRSGSDAASCEASVEK